MKTISIKKLVLDGTLLPNVGLKPSQNKKE